MSLEACIPDLVSKGEITVEQGDRVLATYRELVRRHAPQHGEAGAAAIASADALKEAERQALLKKRRTLLQAQAQARALTARDLYKGGRDDPKWASALLDRDGRAPFSNVEARRKALVAQAYRTMDGVLAKFRRTITGRLRNRAELDDLARERFGEDTGSLSARELSDGFGAGAELLRGRFNAAGGDIGKIERWGLPQWHHSDDIRKLIGRMKGREAAFTFWRDAEWPRLDRNAMIDRTTGMPFTDGALEAALRDVFETLRTDGWSKREPGSPGRPSAADARSQSRFLIYKSADDWLDSHRQFGRGTVLDVMTGHIEGMARDTAAMEILGPNPATMVSWVKGTVQKLGQLADDAGQAAEAGRSEAARFQNLWDEYTGANQMPGKRWIADVSTAVRAYESASKLGSAFFSAFFGDMQTQRMTAKFNGLPFTKVLAHYVRLFNPLDETHRRFAIRLGAGAEGWARHNSAAMRTFGTEMTREWASRLSDGVLRATGMGRHTDAGRWASQISLWGHVSDSAHLPLDRLDRGFQRLLDRYGLSANDWDKVRATAPRREGGADWIFPEDIAEPRLQDRMMEMAATEADYAVPVADLETRAMMHSLGKVGTVPGEIVRNALLFKSFGVAMLLLHGRRVMQMSNWRQRTGYGLNFVVSAAMAGAFTIQMKEIINGRNPRPMDNWGFWAAAMFQGGAFGMIGDLLQLAVEPRLDGFAQYIAGPAVGTIEDLTRLGDKAVRRALDIRTKSGKEANVGRQLVNVLQRDVPGTNVWYARQIVQHQLLDRISEAIDPDYRQKDAMMEQRARDKRTAYFWHPGERLPEAAPDVTNAWPEDGQ